MLLLLNPTGNDWIDRLLTEAGNAAVEGHLSLGVPGQAAPPHVVEQVGVVRSPAAGMADHRTLASRPGAEPGAESVPVHGSRAATSGPGTSRRRQHRLVACQTGASRRLGMLLSFQRRHHGRFFGGRTVSALVYDQELFDQQDFSG